jgi:hypothetical protein
VGGGLTIIVGTGVCVLVILVFILLPGLEVGFLPRGGLSYQLYPSPSNGEAQERWGKYMIPRSEDEDEEQRLEWDGREKRREIRTSA